MENANLEGTFNIRGVKATPIVAWSGRANVEEGREIQITRSEVIKGGQHYEFEYIDGYRNSWRTTIRPEDRHKTPTHTSTRRAEVPSLSEDPDEGGVRKFTEKYGTGIYADHEEHGPRAAYGDHDGQSGPQEKHSYLFMFELPMFDMSDPKSVSGGADARARFVWTTGSKDNIESESGQTMRNIQAARATHRRTRKRFGKSAGSM